MPDSEKGSVVSVGRGIETNAGISINSPLYQSLENEVQKKTMELAFARGLSAASATPTFCMVTLHSTEMISLSNQFPEMRLIPLGSVRYTHALFVQSRRLVMHWCVLEARRLSSSLSYYGVALASILEAKFDRVRVYVDQSDPTVVHERNSVGNEARLIYDNSVAISNEVSWPINRAAYLNFLNKRGLEMCSEDRGSFHSDVVCVDGSLYAYSPVQVASLMLQRKSDVAYGAVPFDASMLLNQSGTLGNFGVHYEFNDESVDFRYPDGVAGVTRYSKLAWFAWLTGHQFYIGRGDKKVWFHLELIGHRTGFLLYRMIKLDVKPREDTLVHAFELPLSEPSYVISSWRLKDLGRNPMDSANWFTHKYVVSKRLVDRVYQFAMQLPREQFTRFAIRKQIKVVNDRVVIEGTSVKVNPSLPEDLVDALVTDLYVRCFCDRYDAGELSEEARNFALMLENFSKLSRAKRCWYLMHAVALGALQLLTKPFESALKKIADVVSGFFTQKLDRPRPEFNVAPSYALFGSRVAGELGDIVVMAQELKRRAAIDSKGFGSSVAVVAANCSESRNLFSDLQLQMCSLFDTPQARGGDIDAVVNELRGLNELDEPPQSRREVYCKSIARVMSAERKEDFVPSADPVYVMNEFHSAVFPGVAEQELSYDTASISLDPQDRHLAAVYLKLPRYMGEPPTSKLYYNSRVRALNVPKRQQTLQELLSAVAARNLNAPQTALPQDDKVTAFLVWQNFLEKACIPEARTMLEKYQSDQVGLEESGLREWATQATPKKVAAVRASLEADARAFEEMSINDYLVMLKSDVKPSISKKPLDSRTEPQVIAFHEAVLAACCSSMFRCIVRRFLSLLKPNFNVNLLKDAKDMEAFVRGAHPFGNDAGVAYLENDFSKYDKSQGKFVFTLEEFIFKQLGLNTEFVERWIGGHCRCNMRALSLRMSFEVLYQRKSGDATTAFGNVMINLMSVLYAYRSSEVLWGVFMGDDSLMCISNSEPDPRAADILAEVFNLGAKTYCTNSPYFASNFILISDNSNCKDVYFVPDPVKRIERWSMMVSALDPQWEERYTSAKDAMGVYLNCYKTVGLTGLLEERYNVKREKSLGIASAIATVISDKEKFRNMWEKVPTMLSF
ncbi:RNA-dependent RNA polymerase [Erysiphe necator associated virga-like virus 9]|nr:RNA-dependent RNA polymerase [Erysiphe necator associated virga-like virus 9]